MHALLKRFAGRFALTLTLVVLEAAGWILFPLVIGRAIDSVLADSTRGLWEFAILGIVTMGIAVLRRIVDSRAYARIYVTLGEEMAASAAGSSTSTRTARLGMLRELVEFFENSLPELVNAVLGLVGTVLILAALNVPVFLGCLVIAVATVVLYALTGRLTMRYNRGLNDEHERQVDAVDSGDPGRLATHLRAMMRWNIRLSDLEAANFGVNWVFMIALLVFAVSAATTETAEYGAVFAIVMYVFQFVESMMMLPFFYQQWLRLREISGRLAAENPVTAAATAPD
jgi:ABC-type bacteriocin/lantibiotic exporter with double-glycine peptidase domain